MKKLLAIILAVAMVMSMAVVVSADSAATEEVIWEWTTEGKLPKTLAADVWGAWLFDHQPTNADEGFYAALKVEGAKLCVEIDVSRAGAGYWAQFKMTNKGDISVSTQSEDITIENISTGAKIFIDANAFVAAYEAAGGTSASYDFQMARGTGEAYNITRVYVTAPKAEAPESPEDSTIVETVLYSVRTNNDGTAIANGWLADGNWYTAVLTQYMNSSAFSALKTAMMTEGAQFKITYTGEKSVGVLLQSYPLDGGSSYTWVDYTTALNTSVTEDAKNVVFIDCASIIEKYTSKPHGDDETVLCSMDNLMNFSLTSGNTYYAIEVIKLETVSAEENETDTGRKSGYIVTGEETHAIIIGKAIITTNHELDVNGDCLYCRYHRDAVVEETVSDDIVIEQPTESTEEETEDITVNEPVEDTNPGTGIALAVIPMIMAAAAVVISKR